MLISFLIGLFVFLAFLLGVLVLIQQGKGDMGLGALHSSTQTLFGGSGGQTFFEKMTWTLGAIFMLGALSLTVMRMRALNASRITPQAQKAPVKTPQK